ncbi:hypothetical protein MOQ_001189 [Trypanosoma cruzi marinkellei]|uniref:Uncharacterized protein n=1 Tax=Trypanosoma cruzi marinkellei TaxID=85056 RepID=K2NUG4_TRYCR|nr:hypothetical protein MOQ_001189 [Trypanosoma cruzi marinkellei]
MNDGEENAGPSTDVGSELSIKTIMEQQRVIETLREMITAMKSRLSILEAAASSEVTHSSATATGSCDNDASLQQKENVQLNRLVEQLTSERDQATSKCVELEAAVEKGDSRMAEALTCCKRLKQMEGELRTTRCLLNFAESRYRETELDCRRLKEEIEALSFERSRWKALAMTITNRLDPVTRERALMHITSLEREQRTRTAERRALSPRSNANTAAGAIASDNVASVPTFDAMELISAWGTQQTAPLPPLTPHGVVDDGTRHSSPALPSRSIAPRRKGGRYLVPL